MNNNNVAAVRNVYAVAERKDPEGWINLFTPDGVFVDNSVGATYRGRALADPVRNYGTAFSNMISCDVFELESTATQRGRSFLLNSGS
jgi:hypothetical protein